MEKTRKNNPVYYFAVAGLLLFHGAHNYFWLLKNSRIPSWDEATHQLQCLGIREFLSALPLSLLDLFSLDLHYPFFFHSIAAIFSLLLGSSPDMFALANLLFLGVLLFSSFEIGKLLFDDASAFFSTFLLSFYPIVFGSSRVVLIDCAFISMVSVTFMLLLKAYRSKRTLYVVFFGFSLGMLLLTRVIGALYFFVPCLYYSYRVFQKEEVITHKKKSVFVVVCSIIVLICLLWYPKHFIAYLRVGRLFDAWFPSVYVRLALWRECFPFGTIALYVFCNVMPVLFLIWWVRKRKQVSQLCRVWFVGFAFLVSPLPIYFSSYLNRFSLEIAFERYCSVWNSLSLVPQIGTVFSLFFVVGVLALVRSRKTAHFSLLCSLVVLPVTFFANFYLVGRQVVPCLLVVALLTSVSVVRIKKGWLKWGLVIFLVMWSFFQFYYLSFGLFQDRINEKTSHYMWKPLPDEVLISIPLNDVEQKDFFNVLNYIHQSSVGADALKIGLLYDSWCFNQVSFSLVSKMYGFQNVFYDVNTLSEEEVSAMSYDYLIGLSNPWKWSNTVAQDGNHENQLIFPRPGNASYALVKELRFQRTNDFLVYKKRASKQVSTTTAL